MISSNYKIITQIILETKEFPNSKLPVLHYQQVLIFSGKDHVGQIQKLFKNNEWFRPWVNGIYDYHHYHSNNHEVLGIAEGNCVVLLGGDEGFYFDLKKGDVLILPAGVSHKKMEGSNDFSCVGAYSIDTDYDLMLGKNGEKTEAKKRIVEVPKPFTDPVFGEEGPLLEYWKR